ncbi:ribonuclease J [Mycoplasmopsis meleagridis]|uniref:ribonuclease J n=1 Tax=Mycoplasmopsis meleagridis TaxID=29561 RepID=UPI00073D9E3B|nr:ribonuclease J [Mycoplasmopsis meleagridis]KUH47188.1 hydrolase [Mycoplasmopsis meleagridis]
MRKNHINIFALGGLDENGKNCYVLEFNEEIYIINTGTKIPLNSNNGIDNIIPNFNYLVNNKHKIKGVFVSDVKNETFSALPWLLMKIDSLHIYSSEFNNLTIKDRLNKYKIDNPNYKIHALKTIKKIGEIFVQPIELAGSMPGHIGFNFITPDGDILFMFNFVEGDLGIYGKLNFEILKQNFSKRKILALIVDSGRANYKGRAINKIKLPETIRQTFLKTKNNERIIIGAYDEEMVSIQQILDLTLETNRPLIIYGKTYNQLLNLIVKKYPQLKLPKIIDYRLANKTNNSVILITGAIERLYSRFLRIIENNDIYLTLKASDNVIMIAPPVNGLEKLEAYTLDEIAKITTKITDVTSEEFYRHRPAAQDIINLVKHLNPQYIIPAQGLYRYLINVKRNLNQELKIKANRCLILQNGQIVHFVDGKLLSLNGKVKEIGDTIVDGFGVGDISSAVLNERETLGRDGVIIIAAYYNNRTKLLSGKMQIKFIGIFDKKSKTDAKELIKNVIVKLIDKETFNGLRDFQNRARQSVRRKIFKVYDKEPMVIINLMQISN